MFQYPSPAPSSSPAPFSLPTSSVTAYSSSPLVQNLPFQFVSKHHPGQNPPLPEPSQLGSHPYPFSLPTPSEIATPWDLWRDTAKRDIPASQSKYKDSVAPSPTPYQTQYITADRAFAHITAQESAIRHVLALARYAGAYVLQAGFSEEMAHAGLRVEEVYVVLEQEVLEEVPRALAVVFSPFQGVVWTPGETYFVPGEAHEEAQEVFEDKVVGVLVASKGATLGGGGGDGRMATGNGKQVNMQGGDRGGEDDDDDDAMDGGGGNGQGGSDDGGRGGGDEDGGDTGGSGSEGGGGGGSEGGGGGKDGVAGSPRYMNIPLMSTLSTKEDNNSYPHTTKFTAGCCVDITVRAHGNRGEKILLLTHPSQIDANTQAVSPPPGSSWRGPWFRVDMSMLNITTLGAVPDAPWRYTIGLTQVRIMAATHATSIIQSSPANLRAGEDSAKTKAERTQTGGAWVTLSGTPNLRMGGTSARTAGSEGMQRRWEVITHPVNGEGGTGVLWKYSHNDRDGVFERVAAENFEPRPAATFGLGKALPVLEVGVVAYWSSIPSSRAQVRGLFQFMRMRGKEQAALPAFANFLHQASMEVDLAKVSEGSSWIVGANLSDEQTISGLRKAGGAVHFEPTAWTASNSQPLESVCEVVFRRAIEGRISELTEGERLALVAVRVNDPGTIRGAIQR